MADFSFVTESDKILNDYRCARGGIEGENEMGVLPGGGDSLGYMREGG